jgi:hypothetical protein
MELRDHLTQVLDGYILRSQNSHQKEMKTQVCLDKNSIGLLLSHDARKLLNHHHGLERQLFFFLDLIVAIEWKLMFRVSNLLSEGICLLILW